MTLSHDTDVTAEPPGSYRDLWNLAGKVFIILGAGGTGIGFETSRALAELGANLLLMDVDSNCAQDVAAKVGGVACVADATEMEGVTHAIDSAMKTFGHIDGAVDIIGGARRATIDDTTPELWDFHLTANLRHAYLLGHLLGPRLMQQGEGTLTFIASHNSISSCHVTPSYAAAKAALVSWVKSLSNTYAPYGVRSNAVSPATTLTEKMVNVMGDKAQGWVATTALKELNRPADVAAAVAFLVSPAARTITGINLLVDGGMMARDPVYGDRLDSRNADDIF
jgi:NAD(P)-dependent dehydrogenase (short-subunit alcohol dehydrogenase family)